MIIEQELREHMQRALSGSISLNELYDWLMDRSWNMHKDSLPAAVELAAEVEALFFKRSDGLIADPDVRSELSSLLNNIQESWVIGDELHSVVFAASPAVRMEFGHFSSSQKFPKLEQSQSIIVARPTSAQVLGSRLIPVS